VPIEEILRSYLWRCSTRVVLHKLTELDIKALEVEGYKIALSYKGKTTKKLEFYDDSNSK